MADECKSKRVSQPRIMHPTCLENCIPKARRTLAVQKTCPSYLIDKEQIRPAVPSPISDLCPQLAESLLNDFTGAVLGEKAKHGTRPRSSVQPYGELIGRISSSYKPKERVRRVVPRYMNPSRILLLRLEGSLASACRRRLVGNCNVAVDRAFDGCQVQRGGRVLSERGCHEGEEEEVIHDSLRMVRRCRRKKRAQ